MGTCWPRSPSHLYQAWVCNEKHHHKRIELKPSDGYHPSMINLVCIDSEHQACSLPARCWYNLNLLLFSLLLSINFVKQGALLPKTVLQDLLTWEQCWLVDLSSDIKSSVPTFTSFQSNWEIECSIIIFSVVPLLDSFIWWSGGTWVKYSVWLGTVCSLVEDPLMWDFVTPIKSPHETQQGTELNACLNPFDVLLCSLRSYSLFPWIRTDSWGSLNRLISLGFIKTGQK